MELLPYQQQVLDNLADFLREVERHGNLKDAFRHYWLGRGVARPVREQLNIFVLSYASFRTRNKEGRKAFQESNLYSFKSMIQEKDLLPGADDSSLVNIIRSMRPVCIVDESHNARSNLSKDMLENFNPCFILDLTATPRKASNIISYVDAVQLKKYHMVKLPIIVYNHRSSKEVISNAIQLRNNLEQQAKAEQEEGGDYIRPIVLFQAESKTGKDDKTTFEGVKKRLIKLGIAEQEIAIKTAKINELKNKELLSSDCPVRYIITINALKEGWDCPFAYILATIANRHSSVDVEQIVGRVLRQPYARRQHRNLLNNSYVLASAADFITTLDKIVAGLNQAGFSKKDMRAKEISEGNNIPEKPGIAPRQASLFDQQYLGENNNEEEKSGVENVEWPDMIPPINGAGDEQGRNAVQKIMEQAEKVSQEYEEQVCQRDAENISDEVRKKMNQFGMVQQFSKQAGNLFLPQFVIRIAGMDLFGEDTFLFNKEELLKGFRLSQSDSRINFDSMGDDAYRVDLEKVGDHDYKPSFWKLKHSTKEELLEFLIALPEESRKREVADRLCKLIGNMYPIADQEIKRYVRHILEDMNAEQIHDCLEREYNYRNKIKTKIRQLELNTLKKHFINGLMLIKFIPENHTTCRKSFIQ